MNPFDTLDNLLEDYAPAKVRRAVHSLLLLVAALVSIYLAVDGDWEQFALSLIATIYAAANKANTAPVDLTPAGGLETDDGLSYEESGGQPYDVSGDLDADGDSIAHDKGIPSVKVKDDPLWPRSGGMTDEMKPPYKNGGF